MLRTSDTRAGRILICTAPSWLEGARSRSAGGGRARRGVLLPRTLAVRPVVERSVAEVARRLLQPALTRLEHHALGAVPVVLPAHDHAQAEAGQDQQHGE